MAAHQSIKQLQQSACQDGRVIHLANLNLVSKKTDVERLVRERGFSRCTFFWIDMPPNEPRQHKGWCRVQFADKETAEAAKSALENASLKGRPIKIGTIPSTAAAPQKPAPRPQVQPTIAPIAQAPPDGSLSAFSREPSLPAKAVPFFSSPAASPAPAPVPAPAVQATNESEPKVLSSLESLHLTEYPKEWYYTSDPSMHGLAKESLMRRMEKLESAFEKAGIPWPIVDRETGELISQRNPSPASQNTADWNKNWIQVVKGNPGKQELKNIELDRLPEFEAAGWQRWLHAGRPMKKEGSDADPRKILKIEDVWTTDAPYKDTARIFAAGIEMSCRQDGLSWKPGQLLGLDPLAKALLSYSPTFIPPSESSSNLQSATSRSHIPKFPRPAGIGAGWGDFDLFRQWQIHGRQVRAEMVENKERSKLPEKTFQYVPARDSPAGTPGMTCTINDAVLEETKRDEKLPKTLFEMVPRRER